MVENKDKKNRFNGQDGTQSFRLLATGKRVRIIDHEIFSEEKNNDFIKKNPDVEDLFRARFNKYWTSVDKDGNKGLPKINSTVNNKVPIKSIFFDRNITHYDVEDGEIFAPTTQEFKIIPNKYLFTLGTKTVKSDYNKNLWKAFVSNKQSSAKTLSVTKGPLPTLRFIEAEPVNPINLMAKIKWFFFDADSVEVFKEDGDKLTKLTENSEKEIFTLESQTNFKRNQLRQIKKPIRRADFLRPEASSTPKTLAETKLQTRIRLRNEEFQRRLERDSRIRLGEISADLKDDDSLSAFNAGNVITSINGIKKFRVIARNEAGLIMVTVRFYGRALGNNFIVTQTEEGPEISVTRNSIPQANPTDTKFNDIISTIDEENVFFDHVFDINVPFSKKMLDKQNSPIGSLFADVRPTYNFFVNNYEQAIGSASMSEMLLPNMYAFLTELQNENTDEKNTIFRQHITLADTIPDTFIDITNQKGQKIGEKDRGQYFDKYARAFGELIRLKPDDEANLIRKFTNLVTPISNIDLFKEFNEKRKLFPMFFDINFSTDKLTQFAEVLKESQLSNLLFKDIIEQNIASNMKNFHVTIASQRQEEKTDIELEKIADRLNKNIRRSRTQKEKRRPDFTAETLRQQLRVKNSTEVFSEKRELEMWDVIEWIQQLSENPLESFSQLDAGVFLGSYNNEIKLAESSQFDFFKNMLVVIFAGKVKKLVEREFRTFEDILNGKLAYSETAFYKIEKKDAVSGQMLQNFFLPNSNDIDILRFIDTQVKYNKQYTYEIFAYQLVVGNKYSYEVKEVMEDEARVVVHNMPSIKLIKVPYYEFTGRIMDSPPIFPDVNILPFKSVNNKIKFHFNGNVGEYKLEPIIIEPEDANIIKKLREAQMVSEKEFLHYAGDDHVSAFEVFRLGKKPRKFSDFAGNRIALIETDINSISVQSATAGAFVDNILPNKKYYYIFRTIDNHGHISNPTPIYELEIVDNDGIVFPVVKTIEIDIEDDVKACTKPVRKFIQIVPAFQQTLLNEEKSGLIVGGERVQSILNKQNFHLGMADEQLWQKNFKIRLTSKKTGRKIDLNVSFEHNNIQKKDNQGKILNEGIKN